MLLLPSTLPAPGPELGTPAVPDVKVTNRARADVKAKNRRPPRRPGATV